MPSRSSRVRPYAVAGFLLYVPSRSSTRLGTSTIVSNLIGSVPLLACSARLRQSLACGVMGNRPSMFRISQIYTRLQNGSEQCCALGMKSWERRIIRAAFGARASL